MIHMLYCQRDSPLLRQRTRPPSRTSIHHLQGPPNVKGRSDPDQMVGYVQSDQFDFQIRVIGEPRWLWLKRRW